MSELETAKKLLGISFLPGAYTLEDEKKFKAIAEALTTARKEGHEQGRRDVLESEELKIIRAVIDYYAPEGNAAQGAVTFRSDEGRRALRAKEAFDKLRNEGTEK